jgi:hypothetical protein
MRWRCPQCGSPGALPVKRDESRWMRHTAGTEQRCMAWSRRLPNVEAWRLRLIPGTLESSRTNGASDTTPLWEAKPPAPRPSCWLARARRRHRCPERRGSHLVFSYGAQSDEDFHCEALLKLTRASRWQVVRPRRGGDAGPGLRPVRRPARPRVGVGGWGTQPRPDAVTPSRPLRVNDRAGPRIGTASAIRSVTGLSVSRRRRAALRRTAGSVLLYEDGRQNPKGKHG